jgi:ornithine cyclodeaminase/alanine dehydrogenase-like protein (mu-crystallin family)
VHRQEITVYKAMGHVVEDIVAAQLVYAAAGGRGTVVTL